MTQRARVPLAEAAGTPASPALAAMRQGMATAIGAGKWRTEPPVREMILAGVRVLHHAPKQPSQGAVVHFHGGGFRIGAPEMSSPYARALSDACGVDVYCPAYRLAPEHPFPAAFNDGLGVVEALAEQHGAALILAGDSAGGNLAASLAAHVGLPLAGLILHSPWLDLTVSDTSYAANEAHDPLFSEAAARDAASLYVQGEHQLTDPRISPLFADAALYPSILLSFGAREVLAGDARAMRSKLDSVGTTVDWLQVAGMDHVAVTRDFTLPGAREVFEATCRYVDRVLAR